MTNAIASYSQTSSFGGQTRHRRGPKAVIGDNSVADSREIFARNLKFWLQKRNISGAELARRIGGLGRSAISAWLNCTAGPDLKTLGEIATVLQIPISDLFYDAQDLPSSPLRPSVDEREKALKIIAKELGFKIRIESEKK